MRTLSLALLISLLCASGAAFAFGTIRAFGQDAEHEKITRAALKFIAPETLDEIAGKKGTFGAVGAPDRPGRGLISDAAAHCDNGDYLEVKHDDYPQAKAVAQANLQKCRTRMFQHLDAAVTLARGLSTPDSRNMALACPFDGKGGSAKCRVLEELGLALHIAQDFYSHTNWADKPGNGKLNADNPPGLGNHGPAPFMEWPGKANAEVPDGLISGCFVSKPEAAYCNYGNPLPYLTSHRVKHAALNKDGGPIGPKGATGPGNTGRGMHNSNFEHAVAAAIADTAAKYAAFEQALATTYGEKNSRHIICAMRADKPDACTSTQARP